MGMMPAYLGTLLTVCISAWNNCEIGTLSSLGIREDLHNVLHGEKKQSSGTWQTWGWSQLSYLILDKLLNFSKPISSSIKTRIVIPTHMTTVKIKRDKKCKASTTVLACKSFLTNDSYFNYEQMQEKVISFSPKMLIKCLLTAKYFIKLWREVKRRRWHGLLMGKKNKHPQQNML